MSVLKKVFIFIYLKIACGELFILLNSNNKWKNIHRHDSKYMLLIIADQLLGCFHKYFCNC